MHNAVVRNTLFAIMTLILWSPANLPAQGTTPTIADAPQTTATASTPSEQPPLPPSVQGPAGPRLGLNAKGFIQLPNQWSLHPAGKQVKLGDFPAAVFISPDSKLAAVVHCGWGQHELRILDLTSQAEVSSAPLHNSWTGAAWSASGQQIYISGGSDDILLRFPVNGGILGKAVKIRLPIPSDPYLVPADALVEQMAVDHPEPDKKVRPRYPAGIALSPDGRFAYIAEMYANRIVRAELPAPDPAQTPQKSIDAPTRILATFETNSNPYRLIMDAKRNLAYVSLWGSSSVAVLNLKTGAVRRITTDPHPNEMVLSKDGTRLFVACANANLIDVIAPEFGAITERLNTALYPNSPVGSTPNALALSADGKTLLAANADNNNLVVFDISDRDQTMPKGHIPTGWYPTGVGFGPHNLIVSISGKGNGSMANPQGPMPGILKKRRREYIAGLLHGTAQFITYPAPDELAAYTKTAQMCSPLQQDFSAVGAADAATSSPVPGRLGDPSPIRYCIYIIKENRTYDQVLGDMPEGNGDPELCLFGEDVTPNHHAISRQFVLLDNFYCDAEVSADGHEWSMGAYATDYVERTWPPIYGGHGALRYPSEGRDPNGDAPAGHLWDVARAAGVSYRSYGEWVSGGVHSDGKPLAAALVGHIDPNYPQFNLSITDVSKANEFIRELHEFEAKNDLPRLIIIRLPNDHTMGTRRGSRTPKAYVAEHDQGLGTVLEALSKSKFWNQMAVFMVEDDAQNGSDHVDAHRTVAMVAGPFVKHGYVDHSLYSTTSMLRTMELILGMPPMSQFDAAARPMYNSFTSVADNSPYLLKPARVDLTEKNGQNAPMADASEKLDFTHEDANPDIAFNEIIWKSVKGIESAMPPPVRAAFVRPVGKPDKDDDDDD